jgi:hypothetical protein
MRLNKNLLLAFFLYLSCYFVSIAQLDNKYLQDKIDISTGDSNRIGLNLNAFNYMRNTEYYSKIEVGRTLFGYQLNPSLYYQVNPYLKIQAGVFLRNDFGSENTYTSISPTLTLKAKKNNFSMLFGTLEGALSHRIIEPMFDISRVIENRLENGFQVKYNSQRTFFDTWINWEKFIERGAPYKEQLTTGSSLQFDLIEPNTKHKNWHIMLISQFLLSHRGGQIDEDTFNQLYVKMNATAGLRISKSFSDKFIKEVRLEPYYLLYKENSNSGMPFDNGGAMYLNAFVDTKYLGFMLSYWNSQNFIAPRGTAIFQSQSIDKSSYFTPNYKRELLFLRLIYEKPFYNDLYVTARLEPFYDFASTSLDYSYSFYLSYKQNFNFRKAK